MASEIPVHALSTQHSEASAPGSSRPGLFEDRRAGPSTHAATAEDFRFLRQIGSVIEAQTDLVKRCVSRLAESQELRAKVDELLRR